MKTNFIYSNEEVVINRSENVSVRDKQFVCILKKPKLCHLKWKMENSYLI